MLTGGGIGTAVLAELAAAPARDAVDWRRLDIWWGDERFLPAGDPERNETQAEQALLRHVDTDPARVHPMPGRDGPDGPDPEAAAEPVRGRSCATAARPEDHGPVPAFDVLLLGIGPEGHVASLFPGMPALYDERPVVAVRGSPKPPPTRLTLTLPAIQQRPRGVDPRRRAGEGRAPSGWRCPAPGRSRCPRPARAASSARCSCSTERPPSQLPPELSRLASP